MASLGHGELIGHCAAGARRYSGDEDGVDGVLRLKHTGSLFQKPFKRKRIDGDRYLVTLVVYIHQNPQLHGLVDDFRAWPWSSYSAHLSERPTKIQREEVLDWFGNRTNFADAHINVDDETLITSLIENNW